MADYATQMSARGRYPGASDEVRLSELATAPLLTVFRQVAGSPRGLTEAEAAERSRHFGGNEPLRCTDDGLLSRAVVALRSPFVALLTGLGVVFAVIGDARGAVTVITMVTLTLALRIWQQTRSARATRSLRKMLAVTVTARRRATADSPPVEREVPVADVVPGDVLLLRAGDVVPADVRIVKSTNLVIDQSSLTGECLPVAKSAAGSAPSETQCEATQLIDSLGMCFAGTAVVGGSVTGVVVGTGEHTFVGSVARTAADARPESSFDCGVRGVGWTLVRFMAVLVPIVFVINGSVSGVWSQAAMFALAVAVGLTPEMLPVIVTANLARGATRLARDKVIVSRLNAIQDLGGVDVLCVDKTGTLTEDRTVYTQGVDVSGRIDDVVTEFAYLAVYFQDGPHNRLDDAISSMLAEPEMSVIAGAAFDKVDEIGFDHLRRRTTVVVSRQPGEHILICKGDPDQVLRRCASVRLGAEVVTFHSDLQAEAYDTLTAYRTHGMRVLAIAIRELPARLQPYGEPDEHNLVLVGFVGFVDPIRESASSAVCLLGEHGVAVKVLTGDSKAVAVQVARQVGVDPGFAATGPDIDRLTDRKLRALVSRTHLFAELTPQHKARIVATLREAGHVVGFLGDGVNDVPALRIADAGIAADTATDVAKQAADLILLDKDLAVIARGVIEGRRTLANTMKYVKITASSNFGNVLSVVAASVVLPFLPMLPVQLMVANLLYDTAQLTLPWDRVDADYLHTPQRWPTTDLVGFMVVFGTVSSLFDVATFAALWWLFGTGTHPALFQTGWFIEGLLTQLAVVMVLRTRTAPWHGARPPRIVVCGALIAAAVGVLLPASPLASALGLVAPPAAYWLFLAVVIAAYLPTAALVKNRYLRRHDTWL